MTPACKTDYAGPKSDPFRLPCPDIDFVDRGHEAGESKELINSSKRVKSSKRNDAVLKNEFEQSEFQGWSASAFRLGNVDGSTSNSFVLQAQHAKASGSQGSAEPPAKDSKRRRGEKAEVDAATVAAAADHRTSTPKKPNPNSAQNEVSVFDTWLKTMPRTTTRLSARTKPWLLR